MLIYGLSSVYLLLDEHFCFDSQNNSIKHFYIATNNEKEYIHLFAMIGGKLNSEIMKIIKKVLV
jgi:hypothetical protein